jgi:hypothetical protein
MVQQLDMTPTSLSVDQRIKIAQAEVARLEASLQAERDAGCVSIPWRGSGPSPYFSFLALGRAIQVHGGE